MHEWKEILNKIKECTSFLSSKFKRLLLKVLVSLCKINPCNKKELKTYPHAHFKHHLTNQQDFMTIQVIVRYLLHPHHESMERSTLIYRCSNNSVMFSRYKFWHAKPISVSNKRCVAMTIESTWIYWSWEKLINQIFKVQRFRRQKRNRWWILNFHRKQSTWQTWLE